VAAASLAAARVSRQSRTGATNERDDGTISVEHLLRQRVRIAHVAGTTVRYHTGVTQGS
jgi:hypothetical protein